MVTFKLSWQLTYLKHGNIEYLIFYSQIGLKVEAKQENNEYSTVFDKSMQLCQYFVNFDMYAGILTEFWEKEEDKERPRTCPITMVSSSTKTNFLKSTRFSKKRGKKFEYFSNRVLFKFHHTTREIFSPSRLVLSDIKLTLFPFKLFYCISTLSSF